MCSAAGSQSCSVSCRRSDGLTVSSGCSSSSKPPTSRSCSATSGCTYSWQSSCGSCSTSCGTGTQNTNSYNRAVVATSTRVTAGFGFCLAGTRSCSVTCRRSDGTTVSSGCSSSSKPSSSPSCTVTSGCTYAWVSSCGSCSTSCGSGRLADMRVLERPYPSCCARALRHALTVAGVCIVQEPRPALCPVGGTMGPLCPTACAPAQNRQHRSRVRPLPHVRTRGNSRVALAPPRAVLAPRPAA